LPKRNSAALALAGLAKVGLCHPFPIDLAERVPRHGIDDEQMDMFGRPRRLDYGAHPSQERGEVKATFTHHGDNQARGIANLGTADERYIRDAGLASQILVDSAEGNLVAADVVDLVVATDEIESGAFGVAEVGQGVECLVRRHDLPFGVVWNISVGVSHHDDRGGVITRSRCYQFRLREQFADVSESEAAACHGVG